MSKPEFVTVIPSPRLHPTEFVPGIPSTGKTLSAVDAKPLLAAGLVVIKEPEKPATKKETD